MCDNVGLGHRQPQGQKHFSDLLILSQRTTFCSIHKVTESVEISSSWSFTPNRNRALPVPRPELNPQRSNSMVVRCLHCVCVIAGTSLKSVVVFVVVWLCVWKRFVVVCGEIVDCYPTFSARCSRIVGSPDSPLMERNAGRPIRPALYIGKGKL